MNYFIFYAIARRLGFDDDMKKSIVSQYTNGRTSSLRGMSEAEYTEMVNALNATAPSAQMTVAGEIANNMRRKIIALCRSMGMPPLKNKRILANT